MNKLRALMLLVFVAVWIVTLGVCEMPTNVIEVTVPDYVVKKIGGWDYVEIPGGADYLVEGDANSSLLFCYNRLPKGHKGSTGFYSGKI
jgi:hypothetical protein